MFALRSNSDLPSSDLHADQYLGNSAAVNLGNSAAVSLEEEEVPEIDVHALEHLFVNEPENLILIDVRYPNEYERSHLIGSVLVPFPTLFKGNGIAQIKAVLEGWREQNGDRPYRLIIYCTKGVRSAEVVKLLQHEGISGINLADGIWGWQRKVQPFQNQNYLIKKERTPVNLAPLKLAIAPVNPKSLWLTGLAPA